MEVSSAEMQYGLSGNVYFLYSQQICGLSDEFIEKCRDNLEKKRHVKKTV
jgi:hypothetical protein